MGFRCPNCHKDFGNNQDGLRDHINAETECYSDVSFDLTKIEFNSNLLVDKSKRKIYHTTEGMYKSLNVRQNNAKRQYEFIGDHDWKKLNMVSNPDGSDSIECRRCGLSAKRNFNTITPDKRASANKIENCKSLKK